MRQEVETAEAQLGQWARDGSGPLVLCGYLTRYDIIPVPLYVPRRARSQQHAGHAENFSDEARAWLWELTGAGRTVGEAWRLVDAEKYRSYRP